MNADKIRKQYLDWKETCRKVDSDTSLKKEFVFDTLTADTNILDWESRNHYLVFTLENGEMKIHIKDRNQSEDVGCIPIDMLFDNVHLREFIEFLQNSYDAYYKEN